MQIAAVHDDVGSPVVLLELLAQWEVGQLLAGDGIAQDESFRFYAGGSDLVEQAPVVEDAGGVRAQLQPGADFTEFRSAFQQSD